MKKIFSLFVLMFLALMLVSCGSENLGTKLSAEETDDFLDNLNYSEIFDDVDYKGFKESLDVNFKLDMSSSYEGEKVSFKVDVKGSSNSHSHVENDEMLSSSKVDFKFDINTPQAVAKGKIKSDFYYDDYAYLNLDVNLEAEGEKVDVKLSKRRIVDEDFYEGIDGVSLNDIIGLILGNFGEMPEMDEIIEELQYLSDINVYKNGDIHSLEFIMGLEYILDLINDELGFYELEEFTDYISKFEFRVILQIKNDRFYKVKASIEVAGKADDNSSGMATKINFSGKLSFEIELTNDKPKMPSFSGYQDIDLDELGNLFN